MRIFPTLGLAAAIMALGISGADAIPAFAMQTGVPCVSCHIGGFGPQLTPFGRQFKLDGYTMRAGTGFTAPVSAMAIASYLHTATGQPPAPGFSANDNVALDQASLFLAGRVSDNFGGFSQWTYDGIGRAYAWDNLDLRAVSHQTIAGSDVLLGLSLNNSPGVQDSWNTLAAWSYPYTSSGLAPAPAAGTLMDGALAQSVLGVSGYAYWNSSIYTEFGLYWSPSHEFLRAVGVDPAASGVLDGVAPYVRVAYQKDYGAQNFEVGAFGLFANLHPGADTTVAATDHYTDLGLDAAYQFTGDPVNSFTVNARYTHENQNLAASSLLGMAASPQNQLDDLRIDASYYWKNMVGGSVGAFDTLGSADALVYGANRTFKPDSSGFVLQVDYTPFGGTGAPLGGRFNMRIGAQYFIYTRFNGAGSNFDGIGHNASDNNAFRLFTWFAL